MKTPDEFEQSVRRKLVCVIATRRRRNRRLAVLLPLLILTSFLLSHSLLPDACEPPLGTGTAETENGEVEGSLFQESIEQIMLNIDSRSYVLCGESVNAAFDTLYARYSKSSLPNAGAESGSTSGAVTVEAADGRTLNFFGGCCGAEAGELMPMSDNDLTLYNFLLEQIDDEQINDDEEKNVNQEREENEK